MHDHFTSGAINKDTTEFVFPSIATKDNKYACPHCHNDVILRKGKVRVHHFAHKKENSTCSYYLKPTRNHLIKDIKLALTTIFDINQQPIWFISHCRTISCRNYTMSVIRSDTMSATKLRYDKKSNFVAFENTGLHTREDMIREVELKYEKSHEQIEMNIITKELENLSMRNSREFTSISNPFNLGTIFDTDQQRSNSSSSSSLGPVNSTGGEVMRSLRIEDKHIDELNSMLDKSGTYWRVQVSKVKSAGTKYFHNSRSNETTWIMPSDVIQAEENLLSILRIKKEHALQKELSQLAEKKQQDMINEVEELLQDQEKKRVVILELLSDEDENYSGSTSVPTIDIPGLNVSSEHKHLSINANKLMEIYKRYRESTEKGKDKEKENASVASDAGGSKESSGAQSLDPPEPFKVKCSYTQGFQCSSCLQKESQARRKEQTIRSLFYKKYPRYSREHPEISYRQTNSPPNVQAQEAKQRKKKLLMRMREQQLLSAFREQYLQDERLAEEGRRSSRK